MDITEPLNPGIKVGIIIQARLNSTRLPNKVILPLFKQKTVLDMVIDRASIMALRLMHFYDTKIVVAMPETEPKDIEKLLPTMISMSNGDGTMTTSNNALFVFYGSQDDLFDRYYKCAGQFGFDYIYRYTADDPFRKPNLAIQCIRKLITDGYDYVYTKNQPYGMNHECFTGEFLMRGYNNAMGPEREHMSNYFTKAHGAKTFCLDRNEPDLSSTIATIDVPEDLMFWRRFLNE